MDKKIPLPLQVYLSVFLRLWPCHVTWWPYGVYVPGERLSCCLGWSSTPSLWPWSCPWSWPVPFIQDFIGDTFSWVCAVFVSSRPGDKCVFNIPPWVFRGKNFLKKKSVRLIYSKHFQTHLLHCPRFGRGFESPWSGWCDQWTFAQWLATQIRWSGTASTIRRTSQRRRRRKPTKEPTTIKKEYKSTSVICIRAFWKFLTWIKLTTRTIFKMRQLFIADSFSLVTVAVLIAIFGLSKQIGPFFLQCSIQLFHGC